MRKAAPSAEGNAPSADRVAVVVLGASEFPRKPRWNHVAFKNTARRFDAYVREGLGVADARILNLFDSELNNTDQLGRIDEFLRELRPLCADLIVYYVGHGDFDSSRVFYLGVRDTCDNREFATGLQSGVLRKTLEESFGGRRWFFVLDCCFAASALKDLQGAALSIAEDQLLPSGDVGTALLAAASVHDPAIVEDEHTVFSACMLEVLRGGIPGKKARFSLSTLAAEVKVRVQTINQRRAQQGKICAPSPELHVPRQEHGDISLLPFFPNHAHPSLRQPDTPPPPRASRPRDPKKQKGSPDFGYGDFSKDDARSEEDVYVETPSTRLFLESGGRHSVIAGAKGTGKSLLLFKRMTQARKAQGALVLPAKGAIAFVPSDALAALLSREYYQLWTAEGRPRIGAWTACWASALQMTVVRAWRDHAQQHGDRDQLNLLRTVSGALIQGAAEQNPYALLERILEAVEDGGLNVLRGSRVLSDFITKHARAFPPVHMFLDNGDEVFEGNPRFWIASSMSCFIAMTHLCSNAGNRVHFTMTLRPDVIWELRRDSNFPRWDADILHLTWPRDMLYELFIQRIRTLRPDCLATPDLRQTAPLTALLGADLLRDGKVVIRDKRVETDPAQAVYVDAFEFILRNTLRRPRDLVQVGNELVRSLQQRGGELTHPRRVREAIDEARSKIAQAYVHEIAHRWPWGADHDDPMSLGRFLTRLPCNLLSRADVERIDADFAARAGAATGAVSPIEVLASVGLIGYVDEGSEGPIQRFARVGESTVVHLPQVDWYLVNPVLYGPPYHVKAVRGLQVGRDLPFNLAQIPAGFVR